MARVVLVDVGMSSDFEATVDFARAFVRNAQAGTEPDLEVEYHRTSNPFAISAALLSPASVVHVIGHGDGARFEPRVVSEYGAEFYVSSQAEFSRILGAWPMAHCLLMDACETWSRAWHREVAKCLPEGQELLYIGSTRKITWSEATIFTSNFYASLQRSGLSGRVESDWQALQGACDVAATAYKAVVGKKAPFDWGWIVGEESEALEGWEWSWHV